MDKTKLIRLFPGSTVIWTFVGSKPSGFPNSFSFGYTRGITIAYEREYHERVNQKWDGVVDVSLVRRGATITVGLLEHNTYTSWLAIDQTLYYGSILISGILAGGTKKEFTFNKVYRSATDTIELTREIGTVYRVTLKAILDTNGDLGTYQA